MGIGKKKQFTPKQPSGGALISTRLSLSTKRHALYRPPLVNLHIYAAHEDISQKQILDYGNCISRMPKKEEEMIRPPAARAVWSGR
jgi:hypothetical protein